MFKLSNRERLLAFGTGLALVFLLYWYLALNPLLAATDRTKLEILNGKLQLEQLRVSSTLNRAKKINYKLYGKEEQLNRIIKFLDQKFKTLGIELKALNQLSDKHIIALDVKLVCTYHQLLGLINSLHELNTVLVIDSATIVQDQSRIDVEMKLLSGYL